MGWREEALITVGGCTLQGDNTSQIGDGGATLLVRMCRAGAVCIVVGCTTLAMERLDEVSRWRAMGLRRWAGG